MAGRTWQRLEINGGQVADTVGGWRLTLPPLIRGYTDAQVQDARARRRRAYPRRPGLRLRLRARFSHGDGRLLGTAGFGFWNAPFSDPTVWGPALPQAAWFFYGSAPGDLPLALEQPGRGWFAATIDATRPQAWALAPLALPILTLNQWSPLRRRIWPWLRQRCGISFAPLGEEMTSWQVYELVWRPDGCRFLVNSDPVLETPHSPAGPLIFVCWLDNQYLVLTNRGRFRWGTLPLPAAQWLEVADLTLDPVGT